MNDKPSTHDVAGGQTIPLIDGEKVPRLPHERDESADEQQTVPRKVIQQAAEDIERGLVDTDRGPVVDEVYEKQVRRSEGATRDRGASTPDKSR
jgi:hypothetical protein